MNLSRVFETISDHLPETPDGIHYTTDLSLHDSTPVVLVTAHLDNSALYAATIPLISVYYAAFPPAHSPEASPYYVFTSEGVTTHYLSTGEILDAVSEDLHAIRTSFEAFYRLLVPLTYHDETPSANEVV